MAKNEDMPMGLLCMECGPSVPEITAAENNRIMLKLVKDWHLGPDVASAKPGDNPDFWQSYADVMQVEEPEARRMLCANCEYFDNRPMAMETMESVPFNRFDADGGGRGFCHKFDFICHNLRTCQAWEERGFELDDKE